MYVIAITACAVGIAHSYMAAEAIKKVCKKKGYQVKVEIQGSMGIENELSPDDISKADIIVFSNDVSISKAERFDAFKDKIHQHRPHEVIKNSECIFDK